MYSSCKQLLHYLPELIGRKEELHMKKSKTEPTKREEAKRKIAALPKDNGETVYNPHDKGYKRDLSNPKEFLHFLKKYVKEDWTQSLDESQLRLCDKEFIDKDYEGREADLIYEVCKADGSCVYIFILQELQSYVDYTMVFRVLIYMVNNLLRFFMATDKNKRESADFRLPAMIPIVFYNGEKKWSALRSLKEYQENGEIFGDYILNLKYYLIDLSEIDEEYILSTNTVIDNIMYCDKLRKKIELANALKMAYGRVQKLDSRSQKEFSEWVKSILLQICGNKEAVVEEILNWTGNGDEDMAFKYNIIKAFEDERAEGKAEGKAEDIIELLQTLGEVPEELQSRILAQKDLEILVRWLKTAAGVSDIQEFICQM